MDLEKSKDLRAVNTHSVFMILLKRSIAVSVNNMANVSSQLALTRSIKNHSKILLWTIHGFLLKFLSGHEVSYMASETLKIAP